MPMQPPPNQIQLEVQVNQQFESNTQTDEPQPIPSPEPEEEEEDEEEESPEPEEKGNNCLAIMSFIFILLAFLWPFTLALLNYYTDFNLWLFIRSTRDNYKDTRSQIMSSRTNISILTCTFNGENSLSDFQAFLSNTTLSSDTECICNSIASASIDCDALNGIPWTTTNFDYQTCIDYQSDINSQCLECTDCAANSVYGEKSPQYLYSVEMYHAIDNKEEKEMYCHPERTRQIMIEDYLNAQFTACAVACIIFFGITGIWLLCGFCAGCKVRWRDLYRAHLWCLKGKEPKKRSKYHEENSVNRDEFTLFVVAMLFLHLCEDVVQCIIAIMFSIYKQGNGGSECIEGLSKLTYANSVDLVPYTGGLSIVEIMGHDPVVETFFIFSFLSVFFSGLYGIRLVGFNLTKVLLYPWWKNLLYFAFGLFLGFFFILLVLAPFWGAVWLSADVLYLTAGEASFLMWTFIVGMGGYVIAICMPLCFADQLDCACDCGDGCC